MAEVPEAQFVEEVLGDAKGWWRQSTLRRVAPLDVPDAVLDSGRELFTADIRLLWAHWFVESLGDPKRYLSSPASRPHIFADVLAAVQDRFAGRTQSDQVKIASSVADITLRVVQGLQQTSAGRPRLPLTAKQELLDRAGNPPRCWLCGGAFPETAVDRFASGDQNLEIAPLPYVDILRPRGVRGADLAIQVDHVLAFAQGGGERDNLALACAWCNSAKSWYRWLYDADSRGFRGHAGVFEGVDLPKPFWTVRLMGAVRQCEHPGCTNSADNGEVTVSPIGNNGVFNPLNLRVTCLEHVTYRPRLQSRKVAAP